MNLLDLEEKLYDFTGALASATTAPNYLAGGYVTYESNMASLKEFWSEIRGNLKRDADKVKFIDEKLQEAFSSFGQKKYEEGRAAIWQIYHLQVRELR